MRQQQEWHQRGKSRLYLQPVQGPGPVLAALGKPCAEAERALPPGSPRLLPTPFLQTRKEISTMSFFPRLIVALRKPVVMAVKKPTPLTYIGAGRLRQAAELLRQTGSLIESPSGYLHLTARENLSIVADLKDVDRKDISRVLEIVHLTKDADRKVGQYSLGMKQRLGIAMALLGSPKLLILDEPTNGLDPAGIQEMRSLISSMPETTGATVLISSHLLGEIEQMVTQVGILNHGKMLFEGSLQALQKHSRGGILLRVLDVPKSIAVLNRQGIRAVTQAQHPDVLELPALPDEALAALVSTLAENGVGVVGLTAQTKNLEEIFLSLTQNNGEVA